MAMEDATLIKRPNSPFILRAKADGEEHVLRGEMLVGREVECSITLNSSHISRYHAKINVSANGVYIEDLQSTNGTFINGVKIKGRVRLSIGDEVGFDDIIFRVASSESGSEGETAIGPALRDQDGGRTHAMYRPAPPLRPSITDAAAPTPELQSASEQAGITPRNTRLFPSPGDIDLDSPRMSRRPIANEPDFDEHLKQHFDELDALMEPPLDAEASPDKEASPNKEASPGREPSPDKEPPHENANEAGAPPAREEAFSVQEASADKEISATSDSKTRPLNFPAIEPASIPNPAVALLKVTTQENLVAFDSAKPAVHDMDRTQLLSNAQLDQFFERHRYDHDLNIGHGPRLIVTTAPLRGKLFNLSDFPSGSSVQLGRDPNAEIYLNDKTISTDHARISKTDAGYLLSATHAKNGILINGVIQTQVNLSHNDKIQIGRTELLFKTNAGTDDALPRTPTDDPLLNNGQGRRYSILITVIALIVLVGAIVATSR